MDMKQTVEEAARIEREKVIQELHVAYKMHKDPKHYIISNAAIQKYAVPLFKAGAEWQSKQSPWISVKERLPKENENIIIMCEHGAIFNGAYCNGVWFCMDGYIYDLYKGNPIYSSMSSIPSLWEPVAWMPIPSFDEILEANRDVLERIKKKGD